MLRLALLSLLALLPALPAAEMTLEQVREQYLDAMGGLDRFRALQTLSVKGKIYLNSSLIGELVLIKKRPNLVRAVVHRQDGTRVIQVFDGTTAWARVETDGQATTGPMKPENASTFIRNAAIENALVDPKGCGAILVYKGLVPMEANVTAHLVVATFEDDSRTEYYLDAKTFLQRKAVTYSKLPGKTELVTESIPSDYHRVEGILIAYRNIDRDPEGNRVEIIVDEVNFNVGVFQALFESPLTDRIAPSTDVSATTP